MIHDALGQYRREILAGLTVMALATVILMAVHLFVLPPASGPTPTAPKSALAVCVALVTNLETYDWQQPQLSASTLEQYASAKLSGELAAAPHMTAGEISDHLDATPNVTATTDSAGIVVTAKVSIPPVGVVTTSMRCVTTAGKVTALDVIS